MNYMCVCVFFSHYLFIAQSLCPTIVGYYFGNVLPKSRFFFKRQMVSLQLLAFLFLYLIRLCPLANGRYVFRMDGGGETIEEMLDRLLIM
jgi:hypothetical protein